MITVRSNAKQVEAFIADVEKGIREEFWPQFAQTAVNVTLRDQGRHFKDQSTPMGEEWPPSQRAIKQNGLTLVDTRKLRASVMGAASSVTVIGDNWLQVGTRLNYAADMQYGIPSRHVPARAFLGFSQRCKKELLSAAQSVLARVLKK